MIGALDAYLQICICPLMYRYLQNSHKSRWNSVPFFHCKHSGLSEVIVHFMKLNPNRIQNKTHWGFKYLVSLGPHTCPLLVEPAHRYEQCSIPIFCKFPHIVMLTSYQVFHHWGEDIIWGHFEPLLTVPSMWCLTTSIFGIEDCKVHNSIAVYAAMVSLLYSLWVTEAL